MNASEFKFHVSLPRVPELVEMLRDLATHAAGYARLDAEAARGFAERVAVASRAAMAGEGSCAVDFECEAGELRVSIGGDIVRQPLATA